MVAIFFILLGYSLALINTSLALSFIYSIYITIHYLPPIHYMFLILISVIFSSIILVGLRDGAQMQWVTSEVVFAYFLVGVTELTRFLLSLTTIT